MSANNFIYIQEKEKHVMVIMKDADTGISLGSSKRFPSLREAIKGANTIRENEEVEYGLRIELRKE